MNAVDRRVLVLYTGGTLGMRQTERGFAPSKGWLGEQLARMPQFHEPGAPLHTMARSRFGRRIHYDLVEFDRPMDSSNMGMSDWCTIGRAIVDRYEDHDAFIVIHGTDTMAYTASALSFMLENLAKTVILTGSQIPLSHLRNDAVDNLLGALTLAGHFDIPEVGLYFSSRLWRGNRVQKVDAAGLDAFHSGNAGPLVKVGVELEVDWAAVRSPPDRPLAWRPITSDRVVAVRLFPGLSGDTLRALLDARIQGMVLETYGSGNAPDDRPDLHRALVEAHARGVVVVNVTQCHRGRVSDDYAVGRALREAGVVPGADLTPEAALTKLSWLLSQQLSPDQVRARMQEDLRGELTPAQAELRFSFREKAFVDTVAAALSRGGQRAGSAQVAQALYPVLLAASAASGDLEGIRRMLRDGAQVDQGDLDGRTALHLAAAEGQLEAVSLLLERGAQVDPVDRWGSTPLLNAVRAGQAPTAARLIAADAQVNHPERNGRTALHIAATEGVVSMAQLLLGAGASPALCDRWGRRPAEDAEAAGHPALAALLSADPVAPRS